MNRLISTALLMGVMHLSLLAQADADMIRERIQAKRIAVFTNILRLTPEEAQGFWPLYNEFQDKKERLQDDLKPKKQLEAMSDAEVEDQIRRHFEYRQKELDLERDLYQKLRTVLPVRKIARIPEAERNFRKSVLERVQEAREKRGRKN
jgi:hypothetical protein